jgi:hypothetical protein
VKQSKELALMGAMGLAHIQQAPKFRKMSKEETQQALAEKHVHTWLYLCGLLLCKYALGEVMTNPTCIHQEKQSVALTRKDISGKIEAGLSRADKATAGQMKSDAYANVALAAEALAPMMLIHESQVDWAQTNILEICKMAVDRAAKNTPHEP